jgi:hypothetical protein
LVLTTDKRLFLRARPAFDLPFERDRLIDSFEGCGKHDRNRATSERIAGGIESLCMLAHALFDVAARYPSVITSVAAEENVDGRAHDRSLSSHRELNQALVLWSEVGPLILRSREAASRRIGKGMCVCPSFETVLRTSSG